MGTARSSTDVLTCAICGQPAVRGAVVDAKRGVDAFPFCSFRCQTIDLGNWLSEEYRIPVRDDDGAAAAAVGGAGRATGDDDGET